MARHQGADQRRVPGGRADLSGRTATAAATFPIHPFPPHNRALTMLMQILVFVANLGRRDSRGQAERQARAQLDGTNTREQVRQPRHPSAEVEMRGWCHDRHRDSNMHPARAYLPLGVSMMMDGGLKG